MIRNPLGEVGSVALVYRGFISLDIVGNISSVTILEDTTGIVGSWSKTATGAYRRTWGINNIPLTQGYLMYQHGTNPAGPVMQNNGYTFFPNYQLAIDTYIIDVTTGANTATDIALGRLEFDYKYYP